MAEKLFAKRLLTDPLRGVKAIDVIHIDLWMACRRKMNSLRAHFSMEVVHTNELS